MENELVFGPEEEAEADRLIRIALAEDLPAGDVTSESLIPGRARVRAAFVPREAGPVAGIPVAVRLFAALDRRIEVGPAARDGAGVEAGREILEVAGPALPILAGERAALNFLQRLSGIATRARRWSELLAGAGAALL
ncbi:MAG: nicotinate-nucleotide diphosphorylase, partial [Thermoanaerobaculia bacterium]